MKVLEELGYCKMQKCKNEDYRWHERLLQRLEKRCILQLFTRLIKKNLHNFE